MVNFQKCQKNAEPDNYTYISLWTKNKFGFHRTKIKNKQKNKFIQRVQLSI